MDNFTIAEYKSQLQTVVTELLYLSFLWDNLSENDLQLINSQYPFKKDFNFLIMKMVDFKNKINKEA